jgi:hypothetical protein
MCPLYILYIIRQQKNMFEAGAQAAVAALAPALNNYNLSEDNLIHPNLDYSNQIDLTYPSLA